MAKKVNRKINLIVVHCSATRVDRDYTPDQLERDHRARGFNSAGYHFYIRKNGYVHPLRPLEMIGAHVLGYNRDSVGICYEGGIGTGRKPADTRTAEQKASLLRVLKELRGIFPNAEILGHRDLSPDLNGNGVIEPHEWIKMCPCFDAGKEYKNI